MDIWIKKLLWPGHWFRAARQGKRNTISRAKADPQLQLYDRILQTDFLHYGYFDDPGIPADDISLADIKKAQQRYAELILEQMTAPQGTEVLDVGCGMGGLLKMIGDKGYPVTGLTPDKNQIDYIRVKHKQIPLIHACFQELVPEKYLHRYGTVIFSESLQYIDLPTALGHTGKILSPEGELIIIDYFRVGEAHEKSGHQWADFEREASARGFQVRYKQDITENIRPTLAFAHHWSRHVGLPVYEFLKLKLEQKYPGKHYVVRELLEKWDEKIESNIKTIDPDYFCRQKRYYLLKLTRE